MNSSISLTKKRISLARNSVIVQDLRLVEIIHLPDRCNANNCRILVEVIHLPDNCNAIDCIYQVPNIIVFFIKKEIKQH